MNDIVPAVREVTLEDVREEARQHRETCTECVFVDEEADIRCTEEQFRRACRKPVLVGRFTMAGWNGHALFYLTQCRFRGCPRHAEASRGFYVDYPHGYTAGGRLFLACPSCREIQVLRLPEAYWGAGMPAPPKPWETFVDFIRMLRGRPSRYGDGHPAPPGWKP
jgi:hypothetical protein